MSRNNSLAAVTGAFVMGVLFGGFVVGVTIWAGSEPVEKPAVQQTYSEFEWAWNACTLGAERFYAARNFTPEEARENAVADCTGSAEYYGDPAKFIEYYSPKYAPEIPEGVRR